MEFVLHGLAEFSMLGKAKLDSGLQFQDLLAGIMSGSLQPTDNELDEEGEWEDGNN